MRHLHPDRTKFDVCGGGSSGANCDVSFGEFLGTCLLGYAIWQVWLLVSLLLAQYRGLHQIAYYVLVVLIRGSALKMNGCQTSLTWLLDDSTGKPSFILRASSCLGARWRVFVFMALQFVYTAVTLLPGAASHRSLLQTLNLCGLLPFAVKLLWESVFAHELFLMFILTWSAWNGASFYIEVFAKRYEKEVRSRSAFVLETDHLRRG